MKKKAVVVHNIERHEQVSYTDLFVSHLNYVLRTVLDGGGRKYVDYKQKHSRMLIADAFMALEPFTVFSKNSTVHGRRAIVCTAVWCVGFFDE
jgi:hypothetical protein